VIAIPDYRIAEVFVLQVKEIEVVLCDPLRPCQQGVEPSAFESVISFQPLPAPNGHIAHAKSRAFSLAVAMQDRTGFSQLLPPTHE